eukprot:gene13708-biopygen9588
MSEGPRRGTDRYTGASGGCQKGPAVAVTDIQGVPDDVGGCPVGRQDPFGPFWEEFLGSSTKPPTSVLFWSQTTGIPCSPAGVIFPKTPPKFGVTPLWRPGRCPQINGVQGRRGGGVANNHPFTRVKDCSSTICLAALKMRFCQPRAKNCEGGVPRQSLGTRHLCAAAENDLSGRLRPCPVNFGTVPAPPLTPNTTTATPPPAPPSLPRRKSRNPENGAPPPPLFPGKICGANVQKPGKPGARSAPGEKNSGRKSRGGYSALANFDSIPHPGFCGGGPKVVFWRLRTQLFPSTPGSPLFQQHLTVWGSTASGCRQLGGRSPTAGNVCRMAETKCSAVLPNTTCHIFAMFVSGEVIFGRPVGPPQAPRVGLPQAPAKVSVLSSVWRKRSLRSLRNTQTCCIAIHVRS